MERFVICGGFPLSGHVNLSGAKNASLPIMAASLLSSAENVILGAPLLRDVQVMQQLLSFLGAKVQRIPEGVLIDTSGINNTDIPDHLMREMRATVFLMGPLLGRFGRVRLSYPGGCAIGPRPINWHLSGLEQLGARVTEKHGYILAEAARLHGAEIQLDFPSVGATENIMMAAVRAKGTTIIRNPAREPEIIDLQNFLNKMGAKVSGAGLDVIRIVGVDHLHAAEHTVISDRIEAGTFMIAAALTNGDVMINQAVAEHLTPVIAKLREAGVEVRESIQGVRVIGGGRMRSVDIKTLPHPGFPTDLQAPMMSLLTVAHGTGIISENVFENRYKYVDELRRMGANINVEGRVAVVRGVETLTGATVAAPDLRAGAALVLAGLIAEGTTEVDWIHHVERGYENFDGKLQELGANIQKVTIPL